jgi:hypothetical protein
MRTPKSLALSAVLVVLAGVACAESPTTPDPSGPAFATVSRDQTRWTQTDTLVNPCTQEELTYSINYVDQEVVVIRDGGASVHVIINGQGSAVGSFGNRYRISVEQVVAVVEQGASTLNVVVNIKVVSSGKGENFTAKIYEKVTLNPDGTVVVERIGQSTSCPIT